MRIPLVVMALVLSGAILLAACASPPSTTSGPPKTELALPTGQAAVPTSHPEKPIPTSTTEVPRADASLPLSAAGPWWVYQDGEQLWVLNADGSGRTELPLEPGLSLNQWAGAPWGGRVAMLLSAGIEGAARLQIYSIPGSGVEADIEVLPGGQPAIDLDNPDMDLVTSYWAIEDIISLAWSPDGTRLAFIGRFGEPTADLYLYDTEDGSIVRLTSGPSHAYRPIWSPDGVYILHPAVWSFGTGAGYNMAGVWAAAADGSTILDVDTGGLRSDFLFAGWTSPRTFISSDFGANCSVFGIRSVDLESGGATFLWRDPYRDFAFDPAGGALVVVIDPGLVGVPECDTTGALGAVFVAPDGASISEITEEEAYEVEWSPVEQVFYLRTSTWMRVGTDGTILGSRASTPCPSPDGGLWAYLQPRLAVLPAGPDQADSSHTCERQRVEWAGDGQSILLNVAGAAYVASAPGFTPILVGEFAAQSDEAQAAWIEP